MADGVGVRRLAPRIVRAVWSFADDAHFGLGTHPGFALKARAAASPDNLLSGDGRCVPLILIQPYVLPYAFRSWPDSLSRPSGRPTKGRPTSLAPWFGAPWLHRSDRRT